MVDLRKYSDDYLEILTGELKGLNLTRILDSEEFYHKQILDSVNPYLVCPSVKTLFDQAENIIDIGFGGGFPLLPLAKILAHKNFFGFEARAKKVKAVNQIANLLSQKNIHCFHQRVEEVAFDLPKTLITFKAVGRVDKFLNMISSKRKDLRVAFYKGPNFDKEEGQSLKLKNWELILKTDYQVEGTEKRTILLFKPRNVLHGTKKNLVNLSEIVSNGLEN